MFSGNAELAHLSPKKLKCRFICEDHFEKTAFMTKKLITSAVPLKYSHPVHSCKEYKPKICTKSQEYEPIPSTSAGPRDEVCFLTPTKVSRSKSDSDSDDDTRILTETTTLPSPEKKDSPKSAMSLKRRLVYTEKRLRTTERKLKKKVHCPCLEI